MSDVDTNMSHIEYDTNLVQHYNVAGNPLDPNSYILCQIDILYRRLDRLQKRINILEGKDENYSAQVQCKANES